jgi:hypothetical protein
MELFYINCHSCGYEAFDQYAAFVRTTASDDWYECPHCKKETSDFIECESEGVSC